MKSISRLKMNRAFKLALSVTVVLALLLSMAACGEKKNPETNELKSGETKTITLDMEPKEDTGKKKDKYVNPAATDTPGDFVYVFTPEDEAEYTFRFAEDSGHSGRADSMTAGLYDGSGKLLAPETKGAFAFSVKLARGAQYELRVHTDSKKDVVGNLSVKKYSDDSKTTVNYLHPVQLQLGTTAEKGGGLRIYSYKIDYTGWYGVGTNAGELMFFKDSSGMTPLTFEKENAYPPEEFGLEEFGTRRCFYVESGQYICFGVNSAEDYNVKVAQAKTTPDEASAIEFYKVLVARYGRALLSFKMDTVDFYDAPVKSVDDIDADETTTLDSLTGKGKKLSTYMSEKDLTAMRGLFNSNAYIVFYKYADITSVGEKIYGKDQCYFSFKGDPENNYAYKTSKNYVLCQQGWGDDGQSFSFKMGTTRTTTDFVEVKSNITIKNSFSGTSVTNTYSFVFFNTAQGTRLWITPNRLINSFPMYTDNTMPDLPKVLMDAFEPETKVTVNNKSDLTMRKTPEKDGSSIIVIPNKTVIRSYGQKDGWYYVKFAGIYGWVDGQYIKK